MANLILKEGANPNYLATICQIGETHAIEGADKIQKVVINGYDMVISKEMKTGDIVVYFPIESAISEKYLSANNLYEISEYERNSNMKEVAAILAKAEGLIGSGKAKEGKSVKDEAKKMVGFFNKRGRVRILKLRGISSEGFVAGVDSLEKAYPSLVGTDWNSLIGTKFNYVDDEELCWKYIPPIKVVEPQTNGKQGFFKKRMKRLKRFDKLIPGTFVFHYDTKKLNECIDALSPQDIVTISVKVHGSSLILANIPIKKKLSLWAKIKKAFGRKVELTEYGNIYSSRHVIKNQYINPKANDQSFYESDIFGCVNRDFAQYLDNDMTVYGEVVGYLEGSATMIQKDHDYGAAVGEWKFMPYRITTLNEDGTKKEWNLGDVLGWTLRLKSEHPELEKKILPVDILYHGRLMDLYPDIPVDEHWHENLLARMKTDTDLLGMELKEPMCHLYEKEATAALEVLNAAIAENQPKKSIDKLRAEYEKWESMRAPREGVVIRIDDDPTAEAWKLKTEAHFHREAKLHDEGVVDMEEAEELMSEQQTEE